MSNLSALLCWQSRLAPLIGQQGEFSKLLTWAQADHPQERIRVLAGCGGAGKTRLAAEVAQRLLDDRWGDAGFLRSDEEDLGIDKNRRYFVLLDYPEEHRRSAQRLMKLAAAYENIILLLLTRCPADVWREEAECCHASHLVAEQDVAIPHLSSDDAVELYEAVVERLISESKDDRPKYGQGDVHKWIMRKPTLHVLPLFVSAAAIYAVIEPDKPLGYDGAEIVKALVRRERHGRLRATSRDLGFPREDAIPTLAALAVLRGGIDSITLRRFADPKLEVGLPSPQDVLDKVAKLSWWKENRWEPISPDIVAATLTYEVLKSRPDMAPEWLWAAIDPPDAEMLDRLGRVVYDSGTIYGEETNKKADSGGAVRRFAAWLVTMITNPERAGALRFVVSDERLPVGLNAMAVAIGTKLLDTQLSEHERGMLLRNLADRLREAREVSDALAKITEAVSIMRRLADSEHVSYDSDLANCLDSFAEHLMGHGDTAAAVVVLDEAISIRERLTETDQNRADLAASLLHRCAALTDIDNEPEALASAKRAVDIYRTLAKSDARFKPELAQGLSNLASRCAANSDEAAASSAVQEALAIREKLAEQNPARYGHELARTLANHSRVLKDTDQARAIEQVRRSVEIYEPLARDEPARFEETYAKLVYLLSLRLRDAKQNPAAIVKLNQAIVIFDRLAQRQPSYFEPTLAWAHSVMARMLETQGSNDVALVRMQEAVRLFRRCLARASEETTMDFGERTPAYVLLREREAGTHRDNLTMNLRYLGSILHANGLEDEANAAIAEAEMLENTSADQLIQRRKLVP